MTWLVEEDSEEGYDLSRTKPKYSVILQEEEYETEDDGPSGYDNGPEANYERDSQLETWDPWEPAYFFRIQ